MPQFFSKIVGVTFANPDGSDRQELIEDLDDMLQNSPFVDLLLKREPENAYDSNAIQVLDGKGRQLGYLSRSVCTTLAPIMDNGVEVKCHLEQITGHSLDQNFGINVQIIYWCDCCFRSWKSFHPSCIFWLNTEISKSLVAYRLGTAEIFCALKRSPLY